MLQTHNNFLKGSVSTAENHSNQDPSDVQTNTAISNEGTTTSTTSKDRNLRYAMVSMTNVALENMGLDPSMEGSKWSTRFEGLIAMLSFVTCSGSFWFFPYACVHYGGFFPYQFAFCFIFISVPLLHMEISLGQYASASTLSVFSRMVPAMAGLSAAMSFLIVFRTIALAVWSAFYLQITMHTTVSIFGTSEWMSCPLNDNTCLDYRLKNCSYADLDQYPECTRYQEAYINTRTASMKMSPFMTFIKQKMIQPSITVQDWTPPPAIAFFSSILIWIAIGIVSIGGSKTLGRTGLVALSLVIITNLGLLYRGMTFKDTDAAFQAFITEFDTYNNRWQWVWSWAAAASYSIRALGLGCGGIQKFASLNKFHNKIHIDVLIISVFSFVIHTTLALYSYMFLAELGSYYYKWHDVAKIIEIYGLPLVIETAISEILTTSRFGSFLIFLFWLKCVICSVQGISSYIWIMSSMIIERLNASNRRYGKPLTTWKKRAIIVGVMSFGGLISSLPFFSSGGISSMITIETYSTYGTLFVALAELVTVSYFYGFKRFSVNVRAMIGGKGPLNIYWWLNWTVISPILLLMSFGCVVGTFHKRELFFAGDPLEIQFIGWCLVFVSPIFVLFYFVLEDYKRRKNMEPFVVLFRATGDWGPANSADRREAQRQERALRVRF